MDLKSLNDKQYEAVTAPLGPVLILAGAGSGKTRALAYRIAFLCSQKLADPEHILALTFTNKAAKEMADRVQRILETRNNTEPHAESHGSFESGPRGSASNSAAFRVPYMGTFHSICARILRQEIMKLGYTKGFTIYDSDDQARVVREIIQELHIDKRYGPSFFRAMISSAKNILQAPSELQIGLDPDTHNLVREVYVRYQDYLYHQNAVDFDDLLMLAVKVFQNFPEVLEKYRDLFRYILVDEYQDTNHAQYVFLHLLAEKTHNLFVVGDDAQSIYGFRGSNIRNILNFEQDFPECKVIKLEQNYRSSKNILAVAQKVIGLNIEQKPKTLWTQNDEGPKVELVECEDETGEAELIARKIIKMSSPQKEEVEYEPEEEEEKPSGGFSILDHFLKKARTQNKKGGPQFPSFLPQLPRDHEPLRQFAVLFRTHAQSRVLEEIFIQSAIPYQIIGGVRFYERKEIKDVIAYLRLAVNYRDLVSLKRVLNEPARGIGERSYLLIKDAVMAESVAAKTSSREPLPLDQFAAKLKGVKFGPKIAAAVDSFFLLLGRIGNLEPAEDLKALMRLVVKRTGYEEWVRDGTESGETRWENVEELLTVAEKFGGRPWKEGLEAFLEEVALITEIEESQEERDSVTLMTLHSAKGLEFDTVFLIGLEEGVLPHSRSLMEPAELSEEIRLAYVGLTRARQNLVMTYARRRRAFGSVQYNQPSRILRVLPRDKVNFKGSSYGSPFQQEEGENTYEELEF